MWDDFCAAVNTENIPKVRKLIKNKTIMTKTKGNPLELAVSTNKNKVVRCLCQMGFNVNKTTDTNLNTPLHIAVLNNNLPVIRTLLEYNADIEKINAYLYTPFLSAMENGNENIIRFLLTHLPFWRQALGLNLWVHLTNQCPIRSLIRNRDTRVAPYVVKLLREGVSPNIRCSNGNTPILETMYTKNAETTVALIRTFNNYGAEVNYFNSQGICPLFKAVSLDDPTLVNALLENRFLQINLPNMFKLTPLFYAVSNSKNVNIIKALMKRNADPNIEAAFTMRDIITDTASAMLQAVIKGKVSILEIFHNYGYTPKRSWFQSANCNGDAWKKAEKLSREVPSLRSLARKTVKNALASEVNLPTAEQLQTLELPKSLISYIAFI